MRRIDVEQPKQSIWDKEVDVRISVKELAIIRAVLGDTSNGQISQQLSRIIGKDQFYLIEGDEDVPLNLYQEVGEILRQEGAIE